MKHGKKLLVLLVVPFALNAVEVDQNLFLDQDSLLKKIEGVTAAFLSQKAGMKAMKTLISQSNQVFDSLSKRRSDVLDCIEDSIKSVFADLEKCGKDKMALNSAIDIERRKIESDIEKYRAQAQKEISSLQIAIAEIDQEIEAIKNALATLTDMTDENVNQTLTKLQSARTAYAEMLAERSAFLTTLDTYLQRLRTYSVNTENDLNDMSSDYCEVAE